jgi:hypothetical protein
VTGKAKTSLFVDENSTFRVEDLQDKNVVSSTAHLLRST